MKEVLDLKKVVKKADGKQTPYQVDLRRYLQWKYINDIFSHPLDESYQVQAIKDLKLENWVDQATMIQKPIKRTDTFIKNDP